jgi:hypothetical protein
MAPEMLVDINSMHTRKDNYPQAHRYNTVVALHQYNSGFNIEPKGTVSDDD